MFWFYWLIDPQNEVIQFNEQSLPSFTSCPPTSLLLISVSSSIGAAEKINYDFDGAVLTTSFPRVTAVVFTLKPVKHELLQLSFVEYVVLIFDLSTIADCPDNDYLNDF